MPAVGGGAQLPGRTEPPAPTPWQRLKKLAGPLILVGVFVVKFGAKLWLLLLPALKFLPAILKTGGTMLLSIGTILGCVVLPPLAEQLGRRLALALYFIVMFLSISVGFGYVFYLTTHALAWFFTVLFFLGVGGNCQLAADFTVHLHDNGHRVADEVFLVIRRPITNMD